MLVGVDTTTLLASAGILSIAISFGAKELVSDILDVYKRQARHSCNFWDRPPPLRRAGERNLIEKA